jgi:mycothiol synthase
MPMNTRPYAGEADLPTVLELLLACRATDRIDYWPPLIDLRQMLRKPLADLAQQTCLWESDGVLVGFALLVDGNYLLALVHPNAPEPLGMYQQMILWARVQATRLSGGKPAILSTTAREDEAARIALLERAGFARQDWQTLRMVRALDAPLPAPVLPPGFSIRPLAGEPEVEAYVALHQEAFPTSEMTVEERLALMRDSAYLPALDLVVVGPDGALVAFCTCSIGREENERLGRRDGWIALVGTRPDLRRLGLGRAVLLAGLSQLRTYGMDRAVLGTQSTNDARHLYESLGFHVLHRILWYAKDL